ncbi:hypothetical protein ACKWTF_005911 [Chironomus riparius]
MLLMLLIFTLDIHKMKIKHALLSYVSHETLPSGYVFFLQPFFLVTSFILVDEFLGISFGVTVAINSAASAYSATFRVFSSIHHIKHNSTNSANSLNSAQFSKFRSIHLNYFNQAFQLNSKCFAQLI